MEEDVPAAIVRAKKSEPFGFEISNDSPALFAAGRFTRRRTGFASRGLRTAGLIADTLFDQGQIGFTPFCGLGFGRDLEFRIALPGLFKQPFLACVQMNPLKQHPLGVN